MKNTNKNHWLIGIALLGISVSFPAAAQEVAFDPLLDTACRVVSTESAEAWTSSYMWYPGQLSAHLQRVQKQKSEDRCVNVGYPGNFFKAESRAFFRKEVTVGKETELSWDAPGTVVFSVDGVMPDATLRKYLLKQGKHILLFEVQSPGKLPSLIVKGEKVEDTAGWQVSLDGQRWNIPETDARYNKPSIRPDDEQEIKVRISPDKYIVLRNAKVENGKIELGENACLLVDFRHLEVGSVVMQASGNSTLSFSVGESPEETLNDNASLFEQRPIPPYTLFGSSQEITLPEMALRYLRITATRPCVISALCFEAKMWPVEFQMQFECDDPSLNNLWKAGVATLHTSMHNFYLDGVKRDYLPWSMDAIASSLAGDYAFGDRQITRNGISIALMPPHPQVSDWGIVDYPLHALIGLSWHSMNPSRMRAVSLRGSNQPRDLSPVGRGSRDLIVMAGLPMDKCCCIRISSSVPTLPVCGKTNH